MVKLAYLPADVRWCTIRFCLEHTRRLICLVGDTRSLGIARKSHCSHSLLSRKIFCTQMLKVWEGKTVSLLVCDSTRSGHLLTSQKLREIANNRRHLYRSVPAVLPTRCDQQHNRDSPIRTQCEQPHVCYYSSVHDLIITADGKSHSRGQINSFFVKQDYGRNN